MTSFDRFDLVVFLTPGSLILLAVATIWGFPGLSNSVGIQAIVFAVAAYAVGQIAASLGGALEALCVFIYPRRLAELICTDQADILVYQIQTRLRRESITSSLAFERENGDVLYRQVYADVFAAGRSGVVDTYYRLYAFYRGLTAAIVVCLIFAAMATTIARGHVPSKIWIGAALCTLLLSAIAMRMFEDFYYKQLLQQFMLLPSVSPDGNASATRNGP